MKDSGKQENYETLGCLVIFIGLVVGLFFLFKNVYEAIINLKQ